MTTGQEQASDPPLYEKRDPYAALRYKDFRLLLVGRLVMALGEQMLSFAIGWELWLRTHDALALGLVGLERDARVPSASAATVSGAADAFLSYGESAKAEALFTMALAKPGAEQDRLLTRIGIAQVDQGNYAGAQANFAKVGGTRKYIAQLWSIYAGLKAAPAPAAAP